MSWEPIEIFGVLVAAGTLLVVVGFQVGYQFGHQEGFKEGLSRGLRFGALKLKERDPDDRYYRA